ncbi:MAG: GntR family transcriptional regulator [Rhodospirillales bacterium]|nr:GntR family transcriptional regulator [Rhodospirillales bacterium]
MSVAEPLPPLYHRVYLVLRQRLAEGGFSPDTPLLGEHELAAEHGVSRITIRRALQLLAEEGRVVRRRGAGTFVLPSAPPAPMRDNLRGLIETLQVMGRRTEVRLLEFGYLPAGPQIGELLGVAAEAVVQRSVRVRSVAGVAFSHLTAWLPGEIGRLFAPEALAATPMLALLEQNGVQVARAEQSIAARLADTAVAARLGVAVGSALLAVRRQVFDPAGRVVELLEAQYRADMYAYDIALVRDGALWNPQKSRRDARGDVAAGAARHKAAARGAPQNRRKAEADTSNTREV